MSAHWSILKLYLSVNNPWWQTVNLSLNLFTECGNQCFNDSNWKLARKSQFDNFYELNFSFVPLMLNKFWVRADSSRISAENNLIFYLQLQRDLSVLESVFWPSLMVSQLLHVSVFKNRMQFYVWDGINSPHLWNFKGLPSYHSTSLKYLNENTALCGHTYLTAVIKTVYSIWLYAISNLGVLYCEQ